MLKTLLKWHHYLISDFNLCLVNTVIPRFKFGRRWFPLWRVTNMCYARKKKLWRQKIWHIYAWLIRCVLSLFPCLTSFKAMISLMKNWTFLSLTKLLFDPIWYIFSLCFVNLDVRSMISPMKNQHFFDKIFHFLTKSKNEWLIRNS